MKILFLIGFPPKYEAYTWKEIVAHYENWPAFDKEYYQIIKALEHNLEFEREVIASRSNLGIPSAGYHWKEYRKMTDYKKDKQTPDEIQKMVYLIKNIPREVTRITRKLILNKRIIDNLRDIILTSAVSTPDYLADIHYWLEPDDRYDFMDDDEKKDMHEIPKSFNIAFTRKVTKSELIRFIENNWTELENRTKLLPAKERHYITARDLRIVQLRDKNKLKYSEIANQISDEFSLDNMQGSINEDSVKTAYKRARAKVDSLAKSKLK